MHAFPQFSPDPAPLASERAFLSQGEETQTWLEARQLQGSVALPPPPILYDDWYDFYDYYDSPNQADGTHVRWCMKRYRSYNPRTDRFLSNSGKYRRCISPYSY